MSEEKAKGKGSKILGYVLLGLIVVFVVCIASSIHNNKKLYLDISLLEDKLEAANQKVDELQAELESATGASKAPLTNAGTGEADTLTEEKRKEIEALQQQLEELQKEVDPLLAEKNRKLTEGTLIYEDEQVAISYLTVDYENRWRVVFMVENKTGSELTVQCTSLAMDGLMFDGNIVMSDKVAPSSKGKVYAKLSEEPSTQTPSVISGQLRVIDWEALSDTLVIPFSDVVVG